MRHNRKPHPVRRRIAVLLLCAAALLSLIPSALAFGDFDIASGCLDACGDACIDSVGDSCGDACTDACFEVGGEMCTDIACKTSGKSLPPVVVFIILGIICIVVIIIIVSITNRNKSGTGQTNIRTGGTGMPDTGSAMNKAGRPDFDEAQLKKRIEDLFVRMDQAWEAGNMECLINDFTLPTWTMFNDQLQAKKAIMQRTRATRPAYFTSTVKGWRRDGDKEILIVWITATRCIWTENIETGRIVAGNQHKPVTITYNWTLVRTAHDGQPESHGNCPNCGAEIDATVFAKCPHCGTELVWPGSDWQISAISVISQR